MPRIALLITLFFFTFFPLMSSAHPGRTDSSGCHTCKTNCPNWGLSYGEYHCHNAKSVPQPKEPIKSTFGENGTGTVSPAPEYKIPKINSATKTITPTMLQTPEKNGWFGRMSNWFK